MKKVLFIALLAITFNAHAQQVTPWPYSKNYDNIDYDLPENKVAFGVLVAGASTNIAMKYTNSFESKTIKQQNQQMLTGFLSTVIISYATNKALKYFRTHKVFKKIRTKRKYH